MVKAKIKPCGRSFCSRSTGICESLTCGYGHLDRNGYWKYPCYICARAIEAQYPEDGPVWPFAKKQTTDEKVRELVGDFLLGQLLKDLK